jgi:hypothetical protein
MKHVDAVEAAAIVDRLLVNLLTTIPSKGREGSDARTKINHTRARALELIKADELGEPLDECFDLVRLAGATVVQIEMVRRLAVEEPPPVTTGATLIRNCGIRFCLATGGRLIADMEFTSRADVERYRYASQAPFNEAIEIAADTPDQMTFQALISLFGAITKHLVETARPLPRMLGYRFAEPLPSLVMSYRLYDDATRADEMRKENKIIHPAFCPVAGSALSA